METEWRPIPGFEGFYEASSAGDVRRVGRTVALCGDSDKWGYRRVILCVRGVQKRFRLHRLVAATFIGPCPPDTECNHKDGNKRNNAPANLEYVSCGDNHRHAYAVLNKPRIQGSKRSTARFTEADIPNIRALRESGVTGREIARRYGVAESTISMIVRDHTWRHV